MGDDCMAQARMLIKNIRLMIVLLAGFLSLGITLANNSNAYGNQQEEFEIIIPSGTIQLYPPIEIKEVMYYRDGGTTGVILIDKNSQEFQFCLDGRMQFGEEVEPYQIYVGSTHPEGTGAESIPIDGVEEKSLLKILEYYIDQKLSLFEQEKLIKCLYPLDLSNLSEKEIELARIMAIIETLKNRN